MHTYDVPRRQSYQSLPSARATQDYPSGPSATPIFDALYAEYGKSFRSLPGDRSGEEELDFAAFRANPNGLTPSYGSSYGSNSGSYSAYSAGALSARTGSQGGGWQRVGQLDAQQGQPAAPTPTAVWPTGARQQHYTGMTHIPAALPPGPRRGV
ncbi:hypothetical protein ACKI1I_42270 [Streptomyces turgidiscabies]|uniref:Uncharacterized protein n=1 Tax=Streptomyces turgidiscabies (strain Car8) TaxID=698760 RepID=L7EW80_STRT8|nr:MULTISPECIES: hypothetical protein [Streptomyces]ELP63109.1 hypothetical protein STRTUCAR8_02583 [Streptomyces turgidiscabies Car8]MDX3493588.1 hypothetical protein [Streptomyces turgidiscabies]GAQ71819.1 hypothetical protein T45_03564 [Streptomyces turgidiscabies]